MNSTNQNEAQILEDFKSRILKKQIFPPSDYIDSLCIDYYMTDKISSYRKKVNEPIHRINTNDVSFRTLNHWEQKGLIEIERGEDGGGWRKYSLLDNIWLYIITELRKFNYSIE